MSLTADHLVVIGQGRLIADCSVGEFMALARHRTRVRSPRMDLLHQALVGAGLPVVQVTDPDGRPAFLVDDVSTDQVGDIAAANGVPLHELTSQSASLEDVFMSVTAGAVEYTGGTGDAR